MVHQFNVVQSDWQPLLLWSSWENARSSAPVSRDPSAPASPWTHQAALASIKLMILHILRVLTAVGSPFASALAWSFRQVVRGLTFSVEVKRVSTALIGWQGQRMRRLHNVRRWHVTVGKALYLCAAHRASKAVYVCANIVQSQ